MKKVLCAVMAIVMTVLCFALYSCKKEAETTKPTTEIETDPVKDSEGETGDDTGIETSPDSVVGTWTTKISGVKFLFPGDEWDTESRTWNDSEIKLSLQFTESGTVVLGLSKSDTRTFTANNLESINALFGYTLEEVKEEGKYETDEEVVDALLDTFTSLNKTGKYTYKDGILTTTLVSLTHSHGNEKEEEVPAEIRVTGNADKLTFTEYAVESDEHGLFDKSVLPLTFDVYRGN